MALALLNLIPTPMLLAGSAMVAATVMYVIGRRVVPGAVASRPRCRGCGYALHDDAADQPSAACSECGRSLVSSNIIPADRVRPMPLIGRMAVWTLPWAAAWMLIAAIADGCSPYHMERTWQNRWRDFDSGMFESVTLRRSIDGLSPLVAHADEPTAGTISIVTSGGHATHHRIDLGAYRLNEADPVNDSLTGQLVEWMADRMPDASRDRIEADARAVADDIAQVEIPGPARFESWVRERGEWYTRPGQSLSSEISLQNTVREDDTPFDRREDITRVRINRSPIGWIAAAVIGTVGWMVGMVLIIGRAK